MSKHNNGKTDEVIEAIGEVWNVLRPWAVFLFGLGVRLFVAYMAFQLWGVSYNFNVLGFSFSSNVHPELMTASGIAPDAVQKFGKAMSLGNIALQLVFQQQARAKGGLREMNITLLILTLFSYVYGIGTNYYGQWVLQGAPEWSWSVPDAIRTSWAFIVELAPEAMFVWAILGPEEGDFIGNVRDLVKSSGKKAGGGGNGNRPQGGQDHNQQRDNGHRQQNESGEGRPLRDNVIYIAAGKHNSQILIRDTEGKGWDLIVQDAAHNWDLDQTISAGEAQKLINDGRYGWTNIRKAKSPVGINAEARFAAGREMIEFNRETQKWQHTNGGTTVNANMTDVDVLVRILTEQDKWEVVHGEEKEEA